MATYSNYQGICFFLFGIFNVLKVLQLARFRRSPLKKKVRDNMEYVLESPERTAIETDSLIIQRRSFFFGDDCFLKLNNNASFKYNLR